MRCWIDLDASALQHNFKIFTQLADRAQLVPVVKSNAYGHGLAEIYSALAGLHPSWLAVNYLFEAGQLRQLGYRQRIMIVGPIRPSDCIEAARLSADIFLTEPSLLEKWLLLPDESRPRAHIKIDTGMSRQGFMPHETPQLIKQLSPHKSNLVGICSHFANVEDVLEQSYARHQLETFEKILSQFTTAGFSLTSHIAASSSTLIMADSRFDLVRIGISLYGLWPSRTTQLSFLQSTGGMTDLKPVLEFKTEVAIIKELKAGQYIGYGCSYKTLRTMTIAVLPVGYYEGYPRLCSNRGHVLLDGQRCPIVGRICMNMMMIDISHVDGVKPGDIVTLIGRDGTEQIEAATLGEWAETIHYEIVTQLNPAIPRRIRGL